MNTTTTKPEGASSELWALALDCAGQNYDTEHGFDIMHDRTPEERATIAEWAAIAIAEGMVTEANVA